MDDIKNGQDVTASEDILPATDGGGLAKSLEDAFDATVTPEKPQTEAAPDAAQTPPATAQEERKRDASGRFLPKEGSAPGAPTATKAAGESAPTATSPGVAASDPNRFNEPPQSWKADMRPFYDKIPAEVRPYLHQREQELQLGFEQVARRGNVAEAVLNEFVPYADQLQAEGATPVSAMRTLLQTAYQLRSGGPEYRKAILLSLAQQYGVDLNQPLNADLAKAEATAANLMTEKIYGSALQQQQTQGQVQQEFAAFANDPANEFFPQVRNIMALLIENNVARDLRSAYDMAVGMDVNVRKTLIDRELQARNQTQAAQAAAATGIRGAPNGTGVRATPKGESLRDTIARQFENS